MYPLLYLVATRPQLLVDHAEAYVDLVAAEVSNASVIWKRRVTLNVMGMCSFVVAVVLAGVALMMWATIPIVGNQAVWVLVITPLLPMGLGTCCLIAARTQSEEGAFDTLRRQFKADMAILREATGS